MISLSWCGEEPAAAAAAWRGSPAGATHLVVAGSRGGTRTRETGTTAASAPIRGRDGVVALTDRLRPGVRAGGGGAVVAGRRAWVDDDQMVPSGKESSDHKLQVKMKTSSTGGRPRSHHHAEAHSLAEKRRQCKIKEKLKTLQQVVPGCDNSNQASTLDQTIRYMKLLQQHIQAMSSFRCGMKPTSVAVYPVVQQAPCLAYWQGGTSVQREGSWAGPPSYSSVLRPCFHGFTFNTLSHDA